MFDPNTDIEDAPTDEVDVKTPEVANPNADDDDDKAGSRDLQKLFRRSFESFDSHMRAAIRRNLSR